MRKIFFAIYVIVCTSSCNTSDKTPPVAVIESMFTAMKNGDMENTKKFISKADVAKIEFLEQMGNNLDSEMVKKMKTKFIDEFKDKVKDISYNLKNEKINGDKATVDVEVTKDKKTESHTFNLVKEEGAWKISLLGSENNGMFNSMKGNMGSERNSLEKGFERLKKMDPDSQRVLINKLKQMFDTAGKR